MSRDDAWGRLTDLVDRVRADCYWCREQTHRSLVKHLIEETAEVVDAIERPGVDSEQAPSDTDLKEELGDVLYQVVFQAKMASERGAFTLDEVIDSLCDKLENRHPWVFADAEDPDDMLGVWEAAKRKEKHRTSVLEGIAVSLPTVAKAAKVIERARDIPYDLDESDAPITAEECGRQILALIRRAKLSDIDPDQAIRDQLAAIVDQIERYESTDKTVRAQLS